MSELNGPLSAYITRFFVEKELIAEYETPYPLPTLNLEEEIEIYGENFRITKRNFGINEDAFITVYLIKKVTSSL